MPKEDQHKTKKSDMTRQRIISSYLTLCRSKKWDKISVIEICRQAEITRGTFYQYFSDIYDLMEQIETSLLEELTERMNKARHEKGAGKETHTVPYLDIVKFDPAPPAIFLTWFQFCRAHKLAMMALLDRKNGDTYFVKRLRPILTDVIQEMMDNDGQPRDELRSHFVKIFIELHFLSAQTWLDSPEDADQPMKIDDIVNLLNVMRVGALVLSAERKENPEKFDDIMHYGETS